MADDAEAPTKSDLRYPISIGIQRTVRGSTPPDDYAMLCTRSVHMGQLGSGVSLRVDVSHRPKHGLTWIVSRHQGTWAVGYAK